MIRLPDLPARFRDDESGLALTEYLLLLGLLVTAVVVAVVAFGGQVNLLWTEWAAWITNSLTGAPA